MPQVVDQALLDTLIKDNQELFNQLIDQGISLANAWMAPGRRFSAFDSAPDTRFSPEWPLFLSSAYFETYQNLLEKFGVHTHEPGRAYTIFRCAFHPDLESAGVYFSTEDLISFLNGHFNERLEGLSFQYTGTQREEISHDVVASNADAGVAAAHNTLSELVTDVETRVGTFSRYETICGAGENAPFDLKPAQQLLHGLGCPNDDSTELSRHPGGPLPHAGLPDVVIKSFASGVDETLTITGARTAQLLKSARTYINTDVFPAGVFLSSLGTHQEQEDTKEPTTKKHWQNLAVAVCHAQRIDLLIEQEIISGGKALAKPRVGRIDESEPGILLLSTPALNFKYGHAEHLTDDEAEQYITAMYRNIFSAALNEGAHFITLPAAGLGAFGKAGIEVTYFKLLMQVASEYPQLNILYHPAQFGAAFDQAMSTFKPTNVVRATKDVLFLAAQLSKEGFPCATHNPSDADVVYAVYDVGEYWKNGTGSRYVGEEHIGAMSTAPLNSWGLNPAAYRTVVERGLTPSAAQQQAILPESNIAPDAVEAIAAELSVEHRSLSLDERVLQQYIIENTQDVERGKWKTIPWAGVEIGVSKFSGNRGIASLTHQIEAVGDDLVVLDKIKGYARETNLEVCNKVVGDFLAALKLTAPEIVVPQVVDDVAQISQDTEHEHVVAVEIAQMIKADPVLDEELRLPTEPTAISKDAIPAVHISTVATDTPEEPRQSTASPTADVGQTSARTPTPITKDVTVPQQAESKLVVEPPVITSLATPVELPKAPSAIVAPAPIAVMQLSEKEEYQRALEQLELLLNQQDHQDVNEHLQKLIAHIKSLEKTESIAKLTKALNDTYKRLTGDMTPDEYNISANSMIRATNRGLQVLGGIMLALSIAVLVLGIVFFPVLVGAVAAGVGAAAAAAVAGVTVGVATGGAAAASIGFFAWGAEKSGLSKDMNIIDRAMRAHSPEKLYDKVTTANKLQDASPVPVAQSSVPRIQKLTPEIYETLSPGTQRALVGPPAEEPVESHTHTASI